MAIQLNWPKEKTETYFDYPEAYLKICGIEINSCKQVTFEQVWIKINIFSCHTAREKLNDPDICNWSTSIKKIVEKCSLDVFKNYIQNNDCSTNGLITAGYLYLKTLDDYKNGQDV